MRVIVNDLTELKTVAKHFGLPEFKASEISYISFPYYFDPYAPESEEEAQQARAEEYINGPQKQEEITFEEFKEKYL